MVTMEDISFALGCSINAVSKALSKKPDVRPKTCQLVLETAKRMGYVSNSLANTNGEYECVQSGERFFRSARSRREA